MSQFTDDEIAYLSGGERRLARIATIGSGGVPHVTPVGFAYNGDGDTIDVGGRNLTATKKFRDLSANPKVAIVVDDVAPPWQPRGVEVRGRAETISGSEPLIRIHPERIISWGIESGELPDRHARDTATA